MKLPDLTHLRRSAWRVGVYLALAASVRAAVTTDGTVGAAGSIGKVGNDFAIPAGRGTQVGGNLFHSFSEFNLAKGEAGTFSGPGDVSNVLARVTGGSASTINGTLRSTIPGANLFFMNPKGVVFGPNSRLDIDGSFTATTADYLTLKGTGGDGRFDASNPTNDVLTAAPVSAFGFLTAQPAAIKPLVGKPTTPPEPPDPETVGPGSNFTVPAGKKISFIGGDLSFDQATLTAPSGRIELFSARAAGAVTLNDAASVLDGRIRMLNTTVNTSGAPGGGVAIRGGRLILEQALITSQTTGAGTGQPIDVRVREEIEVGSNSRIFTSASGAGVAGDVGIRAANVRIVTDSIVGSQALATATAAARAGNVNVAATSLTISKASRISGSTFGLGQGGLVDVQAETLNITEPPRSGESSGIFSNTNAIGAGGDGGDIRVRAGALRITGSGSIGADTFGLGRGGDVDIEARDIYLAARGAVLKNGIFADSGGVGVPELGILDKISPGGQGGSIRVKADRLQIFDGGLISTKSVGLGKGGDTTIEVGELRIAKTGSTLITGIAVDAAAGSGSGGNLRLTADTIFVSDGGRISANAGATGPGGDVIVRAREILLVGKRDDSTGISAESTALGAGGAAGNVEVVADSLRIFDGARISANTFGGGAGGDVFVRARNALIAARDTGDFTGISAASISTTVPGAGGNVRAEFNQLEITTGGGIAGNTLGPGAGGSVMVIADAIRLATGGRVSADTSGLGAGGSVEVTVGDLRISTGVGSRRSGIFSGSSATGPGGPGGTVLVDGSRIVLDDFGTIAATSSSTGAGGSVVVQATTLTLDGGATIEASATGEGVAGSVMITVQKPLKLTGGSAVQTTSAISSSGTVAIVSASDIDLQESSITVRATLGNAGSISLRAPGTISLYYSTVLAEAGLNGGNIFIDPEFVLLDHSRISANAILGAGGNILLISDSFLSSESSVTASSEASVQGSVQIESLIVDLSGALVPLSSSVLDASTQLREQCARRLGLDFSSFLVLGRGGTQVAPEDPPTSAR